jgi:hypothetical protein
MSAMPAPENASAVRDLEEIDVAQRALVDHLRRRYGEDVELLRVRRLGESAEDDGDLKSMGFGRPLRITLRRQGRKRDLVIRGVRRNRFGRERSDDRAAAVWLDYRSFNVLPSHVSARDMLVRTSGDELQSIAGAEELLLVSEYVPGKPYAKDLERIRDTGAPEAQDLRRVEALATYLARIHRKRHADPSLWQRRLRDLVGNGEGIMGLTATYPLPSLYACAEQLLNLEELANRWRWSLRPLHFRLCQVHGDFHPFNVLFQQGESFSVLDRSRGPWGEAGDDVVCMAINYLFFALQRGPAFTGGLRLMHDLFWETYLHQRQDPEMLGVVQPWIAWRALVLASPAWYPQIDDRVRIQLLAYARNVMIARRYDYRRVERYLEPIP